MQKNDVCKQNIFNDINKIDFDGKIAVITGAGSGLGRDYALKLSSMGAKIVVNDFGCKSNGSGNGSFDFANKVVSEIKGNGGYAVANYSDVSSIQGGENIVKTATEVFGKIDILINNAGILRDKSFTKMTSDDWNLVLNVHVKGAYNVTCPAFKAMKSNGYGRIIMTGSASGLYGNFGQTNYSAAKMALVGMMNSLKIEGKKYNININTIAPISASRLTKDVMPTGIFDKAKPSLVTPLVVYLCSEFCPDSGGIYNVGMGYINRSAIFTNSWTKLSNSTQYTLAEIQNKWCSINDMKNSEEIKSLNDMFFNFPPFLEN